MGRPFMFMASEIDSKCPYYPKRSLGIKQSPEKH